MIGSGQLDKVEMWAVERLNAHPENTAIFAPPETMAETFATILLSIKDHGIWEPLIVKADGTILSGHLRWTCARKLGIAEVPVRVWDVGSHREEMTLLIRSNTDRRQLNKREIGLAFDRLKRIPREEGGAQGKRGRPKKGEEKGAQVDTFSKTRDQAARVLGVGRREAEACAVVFTTPGVPDEVRNAVNFGKLAAAATAEKIRAEVKRQGGEIKTGAPLVALLDPKEWDKRPEHVKRLQAESDQFHADCERLHKVYVEMDKVLKARPLASLLSPTDHEEYRGLLQSIANRVYLEMEGSEGKPRATLTVIEGGKE